MVCSVVRGGNSFRFIMTFHMCRIKVYSRNYYLWCWQIFIFQRSRISVLWWGNIHNECLQVSVFTNCTMIAFKISSRPELTFLAEYYNVHVLHIYQCLFCCSVKPAIFDLFLAVFIVGYLAVVYLAVQVCYVD